MFTGSEFVELVESKLEEHGVTKVVPDADTLEAAWKRAHLVRKLNVLISNIYDGEGDIPPVPDDLAHQIRGEFEAEPSRSWDEAISHIVGGQ